MTKLCTPTAFELLHPEVQRWIWLQGWTELRGLQEQAIVPILRGDTDVIIAASTAAGKTEAAFLPIGSALARESDGLGLVLYVSPLKALINDQYQRLAPFFEHLELPATRWHGDITATMKRRFRSDGRGVLLITPESLEALFVSSGHSMRQMFQHLRFVVIDELHSFIGTERGKQLQSLLRRLEAAVGRQIPRVGLSATLGELWLAAGYLRPSQPNAAHIIESGSSGQELRLIIHGYEEAAPAEGEECGNSRAEGDGQKVSNTQDRISEDLYRTLRGTSNLIFANSRRDVEIYADLLRTRCEQEGLAVEFLPHHGSLSKEHREHVEEMLKDKSRPATAVCTSTLELGIDIGSVTSVAQVGSPFSVASLRQRLGRSGRRGEPAVLRFYVEEACLTDETAPVDAIRAELVQSIALIRLLLSRWCEPPETQGLHLSTLVHQILSLIAEKSGVGVSDAWRILCKKEPFQNVSASQFAELLRALSSANILMQSDSGLLLLAPGGEKIVNHYSFYTVFQTAIEYRLVTDQGKSLGTLPVNFPVQENTFMIFAGLRWGVLQVDRRRKVIQITEARGGQVPRFLGSSGSIHDRVRQEMYSIYKETAVPPYLDPQAATLLAQGRQKFHDLGLNERKIVSHEDSSFLFVWCGDRVINTIAVLLQTAGLKIQNHGLALQVPGLSPADLAGYLKRLVEAGPANPMALARVIPNKETEKFHHLLTEELLSADYASSRLDTLGAWQTLANVVTPH